jgi:hypothetical protein
LFDQNITIRTVTSQANMQAFNGRSGFKQVGQSLLKLKSTHVESEWDAVRNAQSGAVGGRGIVERARVDPVGYHDQAFRIDPTNVACEPPHALRDADRPNG